MPVSRAEIVDFVDELSAFPIDLVCRRMGEEVVRPEVPLDDARHATDVGIDIFEDLNVRCVIEALRGSW